MLSRQRDRVLCGRCRVMLGGLVAGPREATVYTVGGPAVETRRIGADQRELILIEGYFEFKPTGIWRLTNHATKRLRRGARPRHSHGKGGLGVVTFPARIECWNCQAEGVIDRRRLGF